MTEVSNKLKQEEPIDFINKNINIKKLIKLANQDKSSVFIQTPALIIIAKIKIIIAITAIIRLE